MQIIPAIDLRAGQIVRLKQGDYAQETRYALDPLVLAQDYAAAGARWLHLVDLDGARSGEMENLRVIAAIATAGKLRVQAGGGVRGEDDLKRLFDAGVARVVVGSVAVRDPGLVQAWISKYGADSICVALDTRNDAGIWTLPSAGWTQNEGTTLDELAPVYAAAFAVHRYQPRRHALGSKPGSVCAPRADRADSGCDRLGRRARYRRCARLARTEAGRGRAWTQFARRQIDPGRGVHMLIPTYFLARHSRKSGNPESSSIKIKMDDQLRC